MDILKNDSLSLKNQPIFAIGLASVRLGLSFSALRMYEEEGLLIPHRTSTGRRIYSLADLEWIDCIRKVIKERGLNIEGIREILSLIPCWEVYQCSMKARESCEGYLSSLKPCWSLKNKSCSRGPEDCRACDVYLKASMWLGDPKGFWREILELRGRLSEDLNHAKYQSIPPRDVEASPIRKKMVLSEKRKREILRKLSDGVIKFDESAVVESAREAISEGVDAFEAIMDGLAAGMEIVGELYNRHEYFVPELLLSADALYAGLNILKPHIKPGTYGKDLPKGKVIIGTIEGDVHDIGKNIVKMMLEIAGFSIYDLGKDVPIERFVEEQIRTDSDIVAISAMMTTTMIGMKKAVQMIKEKNPNVPIMLGGAPLSWKVAEVFGADGYAESASNVVEEAIKLIRQFRQMRTGRNSS